MDLFRRTFPSATIPPKMHMLEDQTLEWIRSRSVGFGLFGEQGVESIHSRFNTLGRTLVPLAKGVERLRCQIKEHFVHINPQNVAARPPPPKRRKLVVQE